jgi:hypothetical protein
MRQSVTCRLSAEYHQYYLIDEEVSPQIPTDLEDRDLTPRLVVCAHLVVVLTFQPNLVGVTVESVDAEPLLDYAAWDHVVDCSLEIQSGRLAVDRCVGPVAAKLSVPPGWHRMRICLGGIRDWASVPDGEDAPESYQVTVWPGDPGPVVVHKQWTSPFCV